METQDKELIKISNAMGEKINMRLRLNIICRCCSTDLSKELNEPLIIKFYKPQEDLTVFQVNLLVSVFENKKVPYDYAGYHKCIAGQRFIANILEVRR